MEYRWLGRTGVKVSSLCFGTMSFGGDADEATSQQLYGRAREAGIQFFDTADVYNGGKSEEILGRLIASERDQLVIASKAFFATGKGPNDLGASRYHLRAALEGSLRRLRTDRIDLYYLHRFDEGADLEDTLRAFDDAVRAGKILYPAVSNFAAWQVMKALGLQALHGLTRLAAVQPMFNLFKRQAAVEILPMARAEGVAVVPYSPLGGGLLSGKYGVGKRPEQGRLISNKAYQVRYGGEASYAVADRFGALAAELGVPPAALAIAWVRSHPGITAPIIGARNVSQLEQCLAEVKLDDDTWQRIASLTPAPPPATDRNEEGTRASFAPDRTR